VKFKFRIATHELLSGVTFGIFLAVQGMLILEKGIAIWQIGILFGTVVISTALFELPFGALADIHGRIKIYRASRVVVIFAMTCIIFTFNFWLLLGVMALLGMAEALNSGTIDAWYVEQVKSRGEEDKLQSYISVFQASMATGLATGAIFGGYIPSVMPEIAGFPPTTWNLIFTVAIATLHLLLTPFLFLEGEARPEFVDKQQITKQIGLAVKFSLTHPIIRDLLLVGAMLGLAMVIVEAYWQPRLIQIAGEPTYSLLGWATAGYFGMAIFGPILVTFIANKTNASPAIQLKILPFIMALGMYMIAAQTAIGPFLAAYMALMLFISMFNPPAATMLNNETSDDIRSTMQSIFSLVLRGGGAISAFGFARLVKRWDIATVWQIIAVIVVIFAIFRLPRAPKTKPD
jgi:DHA1 family quinolone resistance protein-like MFS transporter